jgi:hypothetical protein
LRKGDAKLAIVAADFCLRRNQDSISPAIYNRWGQGRAYEDIIGWLERETADVRRRHSPIAVIWMTHFPPSVQCRPELISLAEVGTQRVGALRYTGGSAPLHHRANRAQT